MAFKPLRGALVLKDGGVEPETTLPTTPPTTTTTPITSSYQYNPFVASEALKAASATTNEKKQAVLNYGAFNEADYADLTAAKGKWKSAEDAVANYGKFLYGNQAIMDQTLLDYLNRDKFSYDLNGDALYQQYKDQYITQGQQAMMDTMGQATAMTGGYGNSYAQTAGQQTYQGYLQQLNDKVPELYQLALDKYNQEGTDMLNKYGLLSQDRANQYGEWTDGYNKLVADRDYEGTNYYNLYGQKYTEHADGYNSAVNDYNIASNAENTLYDREYGEHTNSESMRYQTERNSVADAQWQAEFDEDQRKYNTSLGASEAGADAEGTTEEVSLFTYMGADPDNENNVVFRDSSGKTYSYEKGLNPYTGGRNPDADHGTFSNGYQPNNVGGVKLSKSGEIINMNGREQNVWMANGKHYVWDGTANKYYEVKKQNGNWVVQ